MSNWIPKPDKIYVIREVIHCEGSVVLFFTLDKKLAEQKLIEIRREQSPSAELSEHPLDFELVGVFY